MSKNEKRKIFQSPNDVVLDKSMYAEAAALKMTFSQYLETLQPSKEGETLDAYERQLKRFGIITTSQPEKGIYASTIKEFLDASEQYANNAPLQVGDSASIVLFPEFISRVARQALLANLDYDVNSLLSTTRVIGATTFKELWIDTTPGSSTPLNNAKYEMGRVGEFGTFPRVQISWQESAKSVYKRGIQIDMSYEFQREASIDILSIVISRIMLSQSQALFRKAIDTAFNGAPVIAVTSLDAAAAAGAITYDAWLKWTGSFGVYSPTTYYMSLNTAVKVITMNKPNIDPVALMASLKQGPIDQTIRVSRGLWKDVTIFPLTDGSIPDDFILTFDKEYCLERIVQAGTELQETERIITQQFESVVISVSDEISLIFDDSRFVLQLV